MQAGDRYQLKKDNDRQFQITAVSKDANSLDYTLHFEWWDLSNPQPTKHKNTAQMKQFLQLCEPSPGYTAHVPGLQPASALTEEQKDDAALLRAREGMAIQKKFEKKTCVCESRALFLKGCTCGAVTKQKWGLQ